MMTSSIENASYVLGYTTDSFMLNKQRSNERIPLENASEASQNMTAAYMGYEDYDISEALYYHILWTFVAPILYSLITIVGTVGNALVIYIILSKSSMRTTTNIMLLNLAIADISFLLICVPFTAYKFAAASWPFGDIVCKVVKYCLYVTSYVTVYTLVAISVLRFMTIVCHASSFRLRTKSNVVVVCILVWIAILLVNIPVLLVHQVKHFMDYSYCGMEDYAVEPLFLTFFIFAYALPLVVICFLYVLIMHHLHQAKGTTIDNTHAKERTAKACKVIVLVVVIFGISWLPLHINSLVAQYSELPSAAFYEAFRILWNAMAYGNSCANPIIYNYSSSEFRKGFREIFSCLKKSSRKRQPGTYKTIDPTETTNMVTTPNV